MKKQLARLLFKFDIDYNYFYVISVYEYRIKLQGEYNEELIERLRKDSNWVEQNTKDYHDFKNGHFEITLEVENERTQT